MPLKSVCTRLGLLLLFLLLVKTSPERWVDFPKVPQVSSTVRAKRGHLSPLGQNPLHHLSFLFVFMWTTAQRSGKLFLAGW